jgi:hypothetical protein
VPVGYHLQWTLSVYKVKNSKCPRMAKALRMSGALIPFKEPIHA